MTPEARAARVRLMIFDVDGVLTDGRLFFGPQGEALKVFDVRDGQGIALLREAGIEMAIISSRNSPIVALRAQELGIASVIQGTKNKLESFAELLRQRQCEADQCGFIGDDWPDLSIMRRVGFAATVADAAAEVRSAAHWIAAADGGRGAVRQLAEFVLRSQHKLDALLQAYAERGAATAARDGVHA